MPEGDLILAWANLGALLEGTMKAFLTVYYKDFERDTPNHTSVSAIHKKGSKRGTLKHPGMLRLEDLITYFEKQELFTGSEKELAIKIRNNRNRIHAFLDSPIDTVADFRLALRKYLVFQKRLYLQMPG
jgi:hypothetical protein